MTKIGIFGGAFDPITLGHLEMIEQATGFFDEILVLPSFTHADGKKMAPFARRMMMIYSAICERGLHLKGVFPSAFESIVDECQTSRVVENLINVVTFARLDSDRDDPEFYFIIGEDAINNLETWEGHERLKQLVNFYVFNRYQPRKLRFKDGMCQQQNGDKWYAQEPHRLINRVPHSGYSSTIVRDAVRKGYDFSGMVSPSVYEYIRTYKLYA